MNINQLLDPTREAEVVTDTEALIQPATAPEDRFISEFVETVPVPEGFELGDGAIFFDFNGIPVQFYVDYKTMFYPGHASFARFSESILMELSSSNPSMARPPTMRIPINIGELGYLQVQELFEPDRDWCLLVCAYEGQYVHLHVRSGYVSHAFRTEKGQYYDILIDFPDRPSIYGIARYDRNIDPRKLLAFHEAAAVIKDLATEIPEFYRYPIHRIFTLAYRIALQDGVDLTYGIGYMEGGIPLIRLKKLVEKEE